MASEASAVMAGKAWPSSSHHTGRKQRLEDAQCGADSSPVSLIFYPGPVPWDAASHAMTGLPYPANALELTSQTHPDEALAS